MHTYTFQTQPQTLVHLLVRHERQMDRPQRLLHPPRLLQALDRQDVLRADALWGLWFVLLGVCICLECEFIYTPPLSQHATPTNPTNPIHHDSHYPINPVQPKPIQPSTPHGPHPPNPNPKPQTPTISKPTNLAHLHVLRPPRVDLPVLARGLERVRRPVVRHGRHLHGC